MGSMTGIPTVRSGGVGWWVTAIIAALTSSVSVRADTGLRYFTAPPPGADSAGPVPFTAPLATDSAGRAASLIPPASDTVMVPRSPFFESPTGTLLKSVAFPGWGQWSNGKRQKAAIYFSIESYFIVKALIWRHRARQDVDYSTFMHARDRRNYFYWLTGATIFISMFDAYADRYLLLLEQTRNEPEEYWGAPAQAGRWSSPPEWRLLIGLRF
jgi:hypothetical protein